MNGAFPLSALIDATLFLLFVGGLLFFWDFYRTTRRRLAILERDFNDRHARDDV